MLGLDQYTISSLTARRTNRFTSVLTLVIRFSIFTVAYLSNTLFEYIPFPKSFCYASDVEYKIVPLGTSMHTNHV